MEIQEEIIQVKRLPIPPEGYYYTQSADVEIQNRVVSNDVIWLACNSTKDDWKLINKEEADAIKAEQERLAIHGVGAICSTTSSAHLSAVGADF